MVRKIKLGDRVRCKIDGFEGVVTSIVEYINGCFQCGVRPGIDKDGKRIDAEYIDIDQLEVIKPEAKKVDKKPNGGYMSDHPKF